MSRHNSILRNFGLVSLAQFLAGILAFFYMLVAARILTLSDIVHPKRRRAGPFARPGTAAPVIHLAQVHKLWFARVRALTRCYHRINLRTKPQYLSKIGFTTR